MIKGQATIMAIITLFISLVFIVGILPAIYGVINSVLPIVDNSTSMALGLIPLLLVIGVIYSFWVYVMPQRQEPPRY